jgi:hypothetical protein
VNDLLINEFNKYSDQGLINLASELRQETFAPDSDLRRIAKEFLGDDNVVNILMLGVPLASVLADRLSVTSPHLNV